MLEDNLALPSNGRLYSKVLNWVQHSLWENGESLEQLMEEVSTGFWNLPPQVAAVILLHFPPTAAPSCL